MVETNKRHTTHQRGSIHQEQQQEQKQQIRVDEVNNRKNYESREKAEENQLLDGLDLVIRDHHTITHLIEVFKIHHSVIHDIIRESCIHTNLEEAILYPVLKRALLKNDEGEHLQNVGLRDLYKLTGLFQRIIDMDTDDPEYLDIVDSVFTELKLHFEAEEAVLIPKLRQTLTAKQLDLLYHAWSDARKIAPHVPTPPSCQHLWLVGPDSYSYERLKQSLPHHIL